MPNKVCKIVHVATGMIVEISDVSLVEYQDNVSTKYSETPVFGRMDPIVTYQGTTRKVSFALRQQDPSNYIIAQLMSMQYPTYQTNGNNTSDNAMAIAQPPLVRVTLADLLTDQLCAMSGFAFTPLVGFTAADAPVVRFGGGPGEVTIKREVKTKDGKKAVVPTNYGNIEFKHVTMRFDLTILHEHELGFKAGKADTDQDVVMTRWLGADKFGPGPDDQFKK